LAARGLGCPVRLVITAGQKGDAPQAATLMDGAPAEFVIADAAYDADHIRDAVAEKGAEAVIPNNPSRSLKHPLDKHLYAQLPRRMLHRQAEAISSGRNPLLKRPPAYLAIVTIAAIVLWLR